MTNPGGLQPKKAHNRVSAENLSRMAQTLGRCGDIDPITGYVCVTQPHGPDVMHLSMFIGGKRDGEVTHTWGGTLPNPGVILTAKLKTDE